MVRSAVLGTGHAGQEANDLLGAEHDGQLQRPLGHRDVVVVPRSPQRDLVEEAQRRGDHAQAAGGELAFFDQMDLVCADLLRAECFGRAVEVPGKGTDLLDVGQPGVEGEIANAHVLEHPLAQRCHGGAPVRWNEGVLGSARPSSRDGSQGVAPTLRWSRRQVVERQYRVSGLVQWPLPDRHSG